MLANPLFHYSCSHISHGFALKSEAHPKQTKICPVCFKGSVNMVEYDCELCGKPAATTAPGFERSQRLFCAKCRKDYNRWETMARKAKNSDRTFPDLKQYVKQRAAKSSCLQDTPDTPEPPLTLQEFKEIAKFGKRASPCAQCEHIAQDKNMSPCDTCRQLANYSQNQDKYFLDSLYI